MLQTLASTASRGEILDAFERDGAAIIAGLASPEVVARVNRDLAPLIERTSLGRDDFTGQQTKRTGALVARAPAVRDLVIDATMLGAAEEFLAPYTDRITLHLTQSICIHPGQGAQSIHRDRLAWGSYLPKEIEPQFNTMWALTDFTADNGATRLVPGSHRWDWERRAQPEEFCQAEMAAGSVLIYSGSVLHGGGENRSQSARLGLNITYCLAWLRQEENQYLSCPPHIAKDLDPELQELLGYTQGTYALGYFSDPESHEPDRETMPPEMALGRKPRELSKMRENSISLGLIESNA